MNTTLNQQLSPWRYLWLIALIVLPALGWYGILDDFSSRDINASISSAGLIYGTARGINALVSLLQGTELNLPFLTFSIGEVLDPVNDLIERFSDIIFFALGSLALQKILLAIVSKSIFNLLMTAAAVITALSMFLGKPGLRSVFLRIFLVIAFFRFSLGLVVIANSWVDATFLEKADQQRHEAMQDFEVELRNIDTLAKKADEATAALANAQKELKQKDQDQNELNQSVEAISTKVSELEEQLRVESKNSGTLCALSARTLLLSPTCTEQVRNISTQLEGYLSQEKDLESKLESTENEIEKIRDEIECLKKRMNGETCHFYEVLPDVPDITEIRMKMNELGAHVNDFVENSINLLVSLLLKSIAIPILFFYILLKIVRVNWDRI